MFVCLFVVCAFFCSHPLFFFLDAKKRKKKKQILFLFVAFCKTSPSLVDLGRGCKCYNHRKEVEAVVIIAKRLALKNTRFCHAPSCSEPSSPQFFLVRVCPSPRVSLPFSF